MPRTETAPIVEPRVKPSKVKRLSPDQARAELMKFAIDNGFETKVMAEVLTILRQAVATEGRRVHVHHTGSTRTKPRHDLLERTLASTKAHDLAAVAVDAVPGYRFQTEMRHDACQTFTVSTNAPV